jgi:hypothetical protein
MQELKRFSVNPELEFLVIDCIGNILSIGKQAQNKEADIWAVINMFTSAMGKAVNQGRENHWYYSKVAHANFSQHRLPKCI